METIRVSSNVKQIEVNDSGEYITINFGDQEFIPSLMRIIGEFNEKIPDYRERAKTILDLPGTTVEERLKKLAAAAELNKEICAGMKEKVDGVFRDDVCRKVFGADVVPSMEAFSDFFDQLGAILKKHSDDRMAEIRKKYPGYA